MAEQHDHHHHHSGECGSAVKTEEVPVETTDRGLFDFTAVKQKEECCEEIKTTHHVEEQDEVIGAEFEKLHVSGAEPKVEEHKDQEEKKGSLLEKFHRSDSASSSSSSDEEEGKEKKDKKKKKGLKEKHEEDTSVPIEKCEEEAVAQPEEKKGFLDKIKEKLPGQHKKTEEAAVTPTPPTPVVIECYAAEESSQAAHEADQPKEKKGFLEKIKEKIPGYHPKSPTSSPSEEEKEKEKD